MQIVYKSLGPPIHNKIHSSGFLHMISHTEQKEGFFEVLSSQEDVNVSLDVTQIEDGLYHYTLEIQSIVPKQFIPVSLQCKIVAHDVMGVWHPNALQDKRLRADWEAPSIVSSATVGAPVINVFGHGDQNRLTIACSDSINPIQLEVPVREEDNLLYGKITFFTEPLAPATEYKVEIRVDTRPIPFSDCLKQVGIWWDGLAEGHLRVPPESAEPVYSTWYSFHQNLHEEGLLSECLHSKEMGYKVLIIDDGWQTRDSNRGYDYTGDWNSDRFPDFRKLVDKIHQLDMKVMIWYSVPFCGVKSQAYQLFKGKFLTENHRWAPVFDPRYPEVRDYLIHQYTEAIQKWDLDGFKLDFIDDFKVYPDTPMEPSPERDYLSVYSATERLMQDVYLSLSKIKPDVLIEFRQEFIGPAMQKHANMFRAFDCPNDSLTNRMRTTDTRLLSPRARIHSDMLTWHHEEPVELAALQFLSILFSIPQLSVRLEETEEEHIKMIHFLTQFWRSRKEILLEGDFRPLRPLLNYPTLESALNGKLVVGFYEEILHHIHGSYQQIDLVNASPGTEVYCKFAQAQGHFIAQVYDCMGNLVNEEELQIDAGLAVISIPRSGIAMLKKR